MHLYSSAANNNFFIIDADEIAQAAALSAAALQRPRHTISYNANDGAANAYSCNQV